MATRMTERRELEGIGYHHAGGDDDCLLVEQWTKRPDDLKGQSVTITKLLSREFRCSVSPDDHDTDYPGKSTQKKFRFRIIIEIEKMAKTTSITYFTGGRALPEIIISRK